MSCRPHPAASSKASSPPPRQRGAQLFHGSPRDPIWEYVLTGLTALESLQATHAPVVLVGHTHVATAISLEGNRLGGGLAAPGFEAGLEGRRWLLNPGSVGQPRDENPDAAFLELDFAAGVARFRRVAYPVARTQEEIRERGLPDALAERLGHGV